MNTLLAINNYYYPRGGAETLFLEHNRMLEGRGWTVVPFCMHHPRNLGTPWSTHFVDEIEFGEAYSLREKLRRVPKVIYSLEARRKLGRLLDEVRPGICHAHNIYHHISPSILGLLKSRGVPVVLTLHDLKIACPAYNMLARDGICERCRGGRIHNVVLNRCIKGSWALSAVVLMEAALHKLLGSYTSCVSRFVVPSQFYIDKFVEWGMPRQIFRHVPNFVDVQRYAPRYEPGRHYVYFGRISREKGIATLIRAAAAARVSLVVAGGGGDLDAMKALARESGVDAQFPGHLSGAALQDTIREARAVVLPSEWYENAPMSVLEAYALGKPMIAARIGGIPELVQEGRTGLCFESGNVESLAAALRQMSDRPDAAVAEMGRQGRLFVEQGFTAGIYLQRILETYGELDPRFREAPGRTMREVRTP